MILPAGRLAMLCVALLCAVVAGVPAASAHAHDGGDGLSGKQPTAIGSGGAAATVDDLATDAAIRALRRGGNAVDAAVTAAGVLGVVEPFSAGIGGGGFMLIRTPDGDVTTIDSRETASEAMRPDSFIEAGEPLDFDPARYSGLSAGVPGTVAGWERALERYGSWSLARALAPGAELAREGFAIDETFFGQVEGNVPYFDDIPSTAALYLDPDGTPRDVGTTQRNPDLARTYALLARFGPRAFYAGPLAEALVAAARQPPVAPTADHVWRPGLLTTEDLRSYTATEREPTHVSYRGLDVFGIGPPSSGGSTVGEVLNILEGYEELAADRTRALHLELEASRYAFADRGAYLADPAFFDVPLAGLLSDEFAAERRALIDPAHAASSPVEPGDPSDEAGKASLEVARPHGSTTHLVVSDRDGTVVSYTFTIESIGGNGIVVPGYGFLLNNELTDFTYDDPEHPNAPAGGKRPRSSMSPTLVTKHERPWIAVGSPGGSTIPGTVLRVLLERLDLGASLPEAIAAPRAVERNTPAASAEPAYIASPEGQALTSQYGHVFTPVEEIGAVSALELGRHTVLAAAEPVRRGGGSAAVERPWQR